MVFNAIVLANKFPFFTTSEISALHQQFLLLDKDAAGMYDGRVALVLVLVAALCSCCIRDIIFGFNRIAYG